MFNSFIFAPQLNKKINNQFNKIMEVLNEDFKKNRTKEITPPSPFFVAAAWAVLLVGMVAYIVGLFNAEMQLNEKGYYLAILLYGLFSAVTIQKSIRDKEDGLSVTPLFYGISWFSTIAAITLLVIGLWNADTLALSEKGFYGISYTLSLFAAICVQKNVRDAAVCKK